jgi:hypothetical protein
MEYHSGKDIVRYATNRTVAHSLAPNWTCSCWGSSLFAHSRHASSCKPGMQVCTASGQYERTNSRDNPRMKSHARGPPAPNILLRSATERSFESAFGGLRFWAGPEVGRCLQMSFAKQAPLAQERIAPVYKRI